MFGEIFYSSCIKDREAHQQIMLPSYDAFEVYPEHITKTDFTSQLRNMIKAQPQNSSAQRTQGFFNYCKETVLTLIGNQTINKCIVTNKKHL